MEIVQRWIWIALIVVILLLLVHPRSNAQGVIGALANQTVSNVKTLQGNGGYQ